MQEDKRPIDELYEGAITKGYKGSPEHLAGVISNDPEAAKDFYEYALTVGYTGSMEHFVATFGVQEGNVEATVDGGEESQASSGAEQTTEEFVMPEIQQVTQESVYDAIQESQKTELQKITGAVESKLTEEAAASRSEQMGQRIKDNVLSVTPENVEDFYKTFGIEKEKTDHNGIMRVDMPWEVIGDMEPEEQSAMLQQLALYNNPELLKKYKDVQDRKRKSYNTTKGVLSDEAVGRQMAGFDMEKAEVLNEAIEELQKDANAGTVSELVASLEGQGIDISQLSEDELKNLEARLNIATDGSFDLNEDSDAEQREDATFLGDAVRGFGSGVLNIYAGLQQVGADISGNAISGVYAYKGAEMADELRGEMTQYLTSLSDDASEMDVSRLAERTVVMLGESAPLMLVAAGAGAVSGGAGAGAVASLAVEFGATAGVSMLGTYGDVSNEEWFNELGGVEKLGYVAETGVAEGLPAVVGARIFKHAFKTAAPSYSAFVANRSAQNLGAFLKGATKSTFLGMLEEGTTEGLTGVWQASADSRYKRAAIENQLQDPNLSTEERNELQAEYESLEFTMEGAKEAFIEGGLGGVLLGGGLSTAGTVGRSALTEVAFMSNPDLKAILKLSGEAKKNAARVLGGMDSETRAARAKVGQTLQLIQEAEGRGDTEAAKQLQQQMAEDMKAFNATRAAREEFYNGLDEDKRMDLATLYAKLEAGARALKSKNTPDSGKAAIRQQIAETVKAINDFRAENDMDVDGRSSVDFVRDINMNIDAVALYGNIAPESGNVDLEGDIETELLQAAEGVLGRGKLDQDARDSIQALADVAGMKGGPVRLHYTRESYANDVGVANAASTNGFFRTEDGTVHIFAPTMTRSTAYHETIHRIAGEDLESSEAGKALGAMLESMPEGVANVIKRLAAANMRAKGVSFDGQLPSVEEIMADSDVVDEVLTEFLAQVSSGQVNVEYRRGFRQGVIKMIDGLTGGKLTPVNRRRIQHMRINQAVDAFNMVRDAFRDSDTEGVKAGIQQLANIKGEAAPVTDTAADTTTDADVETTTDTEVTADTTTDTTTEAAPEVETAEDTTTDTAQDDKAAKLQRIEARRKLVRTAVSGIKGLSSKAALRWDGSKFLLSDTVETTAENQATVDALNELFSEAFAKEGVLPSSEDLRYYVKANQSVAEAEAEHQAFTDKVVSQLMDTLLTGESVRFGEAMQEGNRRNEKAIRDYDAWVSRNRGKGAKFSTDEKGAGIAVYEDGSISRAPFVGIGDVGYRVNGKLFRAEHDTLRSLIKDIDGRKTEGVNIGELAVEVLSGAFVNRWTDKPMGKAQLSSLNEGSFAESEVQRLSNADITSEDGSTFKSDGSAHTGPGIMLPLASLNTTQSELTPEMIDNFIGEYTQYSNNPAIRFGLYKFPGQETVSIDMNVAIDRSMLDEALAWAKDAGQESLFDIETFENIKTGADGMNPKSFTAKQIASVVERFARVEPVGKTQISRGSLEDQIFISQVENPGLSFSVAGIDVPQMLHPRGQSIASEFRLNSYIREANLSQNPVGRIRELIIGDINGTISAAENVLEVAKKRLSDKIEKGKGLGVSSRFVERAEEKLESVKEALRIVEENLLSMDDLRVSNVSGKPQLESMDVDSIDNQNEQGAGSMFMGEVDMRRGKPQLAMGDLDYAIQPSYDPDTYLESYSEDDLPEELRLSMPDPVELEAVLNKSKGAAVFINSDGTKVGVVRGQNIKGGYRYVFLNESQEAKAGFASTSKTHVGVMHSLVQQLDDARKPEDKGAPVAVFVTIQAAETMTGEWYSAKYVADGIAEVLEKGMLTEEQVLDALVDAYVLGESDTAAKRPAKKAKVLAADLDVYNAEVEKAKEKATKELAKDGITEPTEEQINDTYPMHMSKDAQVGFIVREIAKGSMDSERVQELFTSKMTFGGRVSLIGNTLAYVETANPLSNALLELGYTKMEFFREYMDEAPLAMFEKALAADKKKDSKAKYERAAGAITGMVMGGFYADPSLNPEVAKENAKGRVEHQQFDTAFTSNGEVFRLNKPYNVDTLQFRIGAPTKQGVSFYNEHAGGDKYYKGTDKKDIMASIAPSDVSKVESLVEGGMSVRQAVQSVGYVEYTRKHRQGVSDFIMEAAVGSAAPETKSRYGEFVVAQKGDDVRAMAKLMTSPYGNVAISAYPSGVIKLQSDMVERLSSESKAVGESIIEAYNSMDKGEQTAAFEAMFKSQEKMIPFSGQGLVEASQKGEAVQQLREKLEAAPEGKKQVGDVDMLGDLVESMYNGWTASEARTMLKEFGFSKTQVDELMRLAQQRLRGRREGIREEYRSRIEERREARKNSTLATNLQAKLDAERLAGKTRKEATSIIIKLISEVLKEQGIKGLKPQHILQMMAMVAKPTRASKNKLNGDEAADFQEKIIERIMQLESELAKGRQAAEVLAQFKKDVAKARELQRRVRRMQKKKHKDGGIHLAYKQGAMMLTSVNAAHLSPAEVADLVSTLNSLISTQKTGVVKGEVRDRSSVEAINDAAKNFQAQNVQFNTMADLRRAERMAKRENAKRKQQGRAQVTVQEMMDKLYADRHMAEIKRARTTLERLADERGVDISTPEALAKFEEEVMEELFAKNQERIEALAGSVRNLAAAAQYQVGNNANLSKIYGKDIEARIAELEAAGDYATLAKLELALYNAAVNNSFADTTKLASDLHIRFEKLPKLRALIKSGKIKVRKRGSLARRGSTLDTMDSALSLIVMTDKKTVAKVREALGLTSLENGYALADSAFTGIIDGEYGNGAFPGLIGLLKKAGVDMKAMTKAPFAAGLQVLSTLEQMPEGVNSTEWAQDVYNAAVASIEYAAKQDKYSTKEIQEMRENVLEVYEEGMTMEEYSEALVQKHPQSREIITAYRTVHQHARAKWGYDQFYSDALGIDPEMGENYTPFSFRKVGEDADKSFTNLVQDRMTGANTGTGAEHRTSSSRDRKAKAIKSVNGKKFVMDLDFHNINTQVLRDNASSIFAADALYEARTIMNNEGTIDGVLDMHGDDVKMMQQFITQYADADHAGGNVVFTKEGTVFGVKVPNPLYYTKKAAVINAFGSLFGAQIIKQSSVAVSVLAQTRHASSKAEFVEYVALMTAMGVKRGSMNMNRIMPDAMKRMLMENSPVFQRDYESALIDSETSGHVSFDENYFDIVSDKLGNISLGMLKGTDKVMAAASWFAFYSDYVRSEEGREVNWEEESKNPNADAVGHANRMVSKDQAASTARQSAQLYSTKSGIAKYFLDTVMPFSRFGVNKKRSVLADIVKLAQAPTAEAKREAATALAGHFAEMYAFAAVGAYVIPATAAAVLGDEDEVPEFFSTKQQLTIVSRAMKDILLPLNLESTDAAAVTLMNKAYYGAFVADEYTEGMTDAQAEKAYEDWLRRNGASVFVSKDDAMSFKGLSGMLGPAGAWMYNSGVAVANLNYTLEGSGKYMKPNGDVVYIDPDFQDRAAFTSMMQFGMTLGQFAGISAQEVGKLTRMYDDAHVATAIKEESAYLYRMQREGLLGDVRYREVLDNAGLLDNIDETDVNKIKKNAKAVAKDKKFRERIIAEFGEDFYMDHAEELVYDTYLGVAGIAEILREEDEEYVRALKIVLGNSSKLKQAIAINRKRNG